MFSFAFVAACGGVDRAPAAVVRRVDTSAPTTCNEEPAYVPRAAPTGSEPSLPEPPGREVRAKRMGEAYTVWGAAHDLRSRFLSDEVTGRRIAIVGSIIRTNYDLAPACAVHRTGKADRADCVSPVPSFFLADEKRETQTAIEVMGWAANFAEVFTLVEAIDRAPKDKEGEVKLIDDVWGMNLPNPVPAVGARVKVTGLYGVTFTKVTGGASNARYGIMTAERIEYLSPPPERARLPGMKLKKL
jgi:hypothetical protein